MKRRSPRYSSFITATLRTIQADDHRRIRPDGAARLNMTQYRTGDPCEHGHLAWRFTRGGRCTDCSRGAR